MQGITRNHGVDRGVSVSGSPQRDEAEDAIQIDRLTLLAWQLVATKWSSMSSAPWYSAEA
jgi:hypothetical protein